jgi:hypothetical protein
MRVASTLRLTLALILVVLSVDACTLPQRRERRVRRVRTPPVVALVYLDRNRPDTSIEVTGLYINDTFGEPTGVQQLSVRTEDGTFQLPFTSIREIEFNEFLGPTTRGGRYFATITLKNANIRRGTVELQSFRGTAGGLAWHETLAARPDRGQALHRIVFLEPPTS